MRDLRHLMLHVRTYGKKHQALYLLSLVIFFWAVFDGITTYITPLILIEGGMSKTVMGLVYASSSVFGAGFDFLMCKLFKNSYYRRVFLVMFALCGIYILVLSQAKTIGLFLVAMMLWGVYYDLKNFGSFDFVARFTRISDHSSSFGVLTVFQAGGFLVAPLVASFLITDTVGTSPFIAAGIFLTLAFLIFLGLLSRESGYQQERLETQYRYRGFFHELKLWRRLDRVLLPVLVMMMMLNIIDAFFWTIGPILAEGFTSLHRFAGVFLVAYELPVLIVGWFVGSVTAKLGKKRTAFFSLLAGSLVLILLGFLTEPILMIVAVFFASMLMSLAWPAIRAAFADYIQETGKYEQEIEGLEDLYTNIGYVIGPASAGILADLLGNAKTFSVLGVMGVLTAIVLLKITPKKINVLQSLRK
ncbi:MAG: MFS transporter [Patescibacteria group bacterium]|nr:MFS transporter [Patescibacteria group bacterium]